MPNEHSHPRWIIILSGTFASAPSQRSFQIGELATVHPPPFAPVYEVAQRGFPDDNSPTSLSTVIERWAYAVRMYGRY